MKNTTFNHICETFNTLEGISSRNEMTETLVSLYQTLNPTDAQIISYLIQGRVAPLFVKSEFNISEKSILSILEDMVKASDIQESVSEKRKETGDIGDTVQYFSQKLSFESKNTPLKDIYETLWSLILDTGTGSVERKKSNIAKIFRETSPLEAKYISRILCGSLRFGINAKTLLDVFSFLIQEDKGMRDELDRAYGACPDIGYICSLVVGNEKKVVHQKLEQIRVSPGIPVLPRLVERVNSFEEVFERIGDGILVQNKYDGLRCQIHKTTQAKKKKLGCVWEEYFKKEDNNSLFNTGQDSLEVRLFTRNLDDVTDMFPEIVEKAKRIEKESFVLDSEVLGWNSKENSFMTFQETMQRRRKHKVVDVQSDIPVRAMVFDVLYIDGEDISQIDTHKRLEILKDIKTDNAITLEETRTVNSLDELNEEFDLAISSGFEGLIVKQKEGEYLPGVRNYEWIKLKKSMGKKVVDTIDLVAVGYSLGSGRRSTLGVGSILGAVYNPEEDIFEAICNVGTGFSDEQLKSISKDLEEDIVKEKPKNVSLDNGLDVDVWVDPRVVFTVEADEITKKKDTKKLSLRFPRLIEWGRDKGAIEATTVDELESMFKGV